MKPGFRVKQCYQKLIFVWGDLEKAVFPKFEWCALQAAIVLLKLNIVFCQEKHIPQKLQ